MDAVNKAAKKHIDPNNIGIVAVCEAKRCKKVLEEAIDSLASVKVVPYDTL